MALIHMDFFSNSLEMSCGMNVIIPNGVIGKGKLPALYLLHGLSDDETIWLRRTNIERYAEKYRLVIIMPDGGRSFYTDMVHGYRYWTFISKELPELCQSIFPISNRRENRFAAGLSMGGYGAMKLGLRLPGRYAAVASLSGAVAIDEARLGDATPALRRELTDIFGDPKKFAASSDNLFYVANRLKKTPEKAPKMYLACGTEDFLLQGNRDFRAAYESTFDLTYVEGPGAHTWAFWDEYIQQVLAWLPIGSNHEK